MAEKIVGLRVFPGEKGSFDSSVLEVGGGVLSVSQFTLYGDTRKGRRPDFAEALPADTARTLFDEWCRIIPTLGVTSAPHGVFQAHMRVSSQNDGPVTLILESPRL
jgi:D-tyrosyl-tRNA(Tyr) deacylase